MGARGLAPPAMEKKKERILLDRCQVSLPRVRLTFPGSARSMQFRLCILTLHKTAGLTFLSQQCPASTPLSMVRCFSLTVSIQVPSIRYISQEWESAEQHLGKGQRFNLQHAYHKFAHPCLTHTGSRGYNNQKVSAAVKLTFVLSGGPPPS